MRPKQLIERLAAMEPPPQGVPVVPPIELVAMMTRTVRGLRQWKKETLADFASVSLSIVERVERAEPVGNESLERIAVALGYERGAFTQPRVPIPREEAAARLADDVGHLDAVEVRCFRTHRQVRMVAGTQAYLIHDTELGPASWRSAPPRCPTKSCCRWSPSTRRWSTRSRAALRGPRRRRPTTGPAGPYRPVSGTWSCAST